MNVKDAVRRAVPVLAEHGHVDHVILLAWLIRAGLPRADAESAAAFIPLAFGREILKGSGVQFSDTYLRLGPDNAREERTLATEQFFREATTLARELAPEAGSTIALQSSELQAVNAALNGGASMEHLVAGPGSHDISERAGEAEVVAGLLEVIITGWRGRGANLNHQRAKRNHARTSNL